MSSGTKIVLSDNSLISANEHRATPILKWAGGKTQLLPTLLPKIPKDFGTYIEPFFGGGALFFALRPTTAIISDSNPELINLYRQVAVDVDGVIEALGAFKHEKELFYQIRAQDFRDLDPTSAAARTIYLNRTCFNGLYRLNKRGQFNVPFGKYENPTICQPETLRSASEALQDARILVADYREVLRHHAQRGDFVYLDPPYLPTGKYSDFKRYTAAQFYEDDHHELAEDVKYLTELGCHVLLTNSNHALTYDLYRGFDIQVVRSKRNINSKGDSRTGTDLIVSAPSSKASDARPGTLPMSDQTKKFPPTRFMGSKERMMGHIWEAVRELHFNSVLDLFSGSGVVSYMFKAEGKQVFSNDYMAMCEVAAVALIKNNSVVLDDSDVEKLLGESPYVDNFVQETFANLYFSDEDNRTIDNVRANIKNVRNRNKRAIALLALIRACIKKRPRGIFTFVGERYDDGRKDLALSIEEQFRAAVGLINAAVFDNGLKNQARRGDAMTVRRKPDLVYIDPPYYSPYSDNEYVRRYHFVEGISRDWQDVQIQWHTKTRKFKGYPTPFSSYIGTRDAFDRLFKRFRDSIIVVSYSSNALPNREEITAMMAKYKDNVKVVSVDHLYSFGNQSHRTNDNNNRAQEYLFVGT